MQSIIEQFHENSYPLRSFRHNKYFSFGQRYYDVTNEFYDELLLLAVKKNMKREDMKLTLKTYAQERRRKRKIREGKNLLEKIQGVGPMALSGEERRMAITLLLAERACKQTIVKETAPWGKSEMDIKLFNERWEEQVRTRAVQAHNTYEAALEKATKPFTKKETEED